MKSELTSSGPGKKRARSPEDLAHDSTLSASGGVNPYLSRPLRRRRLTDEYEHEQTNSGSMDQTELSQPPLISLKDAEHALSPPSQPRNLTDASSRICEDLSGVIVERRHQGPAKAQITLLHLPNPPSASYAPSWDPTISINSEASNGSCISGRSAESAPAQLQGRDALPVQPNEQRSSRGCSNCRRLKMRCVFGKGQDECQRCFNTNKSCVIEGRKPQPREREMLMHQIAEKEKIIQALLRQIHTREELTQHDKPVTLVTSFMTVSEIIACLGDRGCANITAQLDEASYSTYPIYNGGFGDIYQGCLKDGTKVAIKTMRLQVSCDEDRTPLKHAARELYTWSKCRHKNIHHLLGLAEFRGQIGMVSTWESNGNLSSYIRTHPGVNRRHLIAQVAAGLSYLHQNNIVHGDLKACNILVSQDGVPLLSDFGNATLLEYTLKFSGTSTRMAISTRWAAPEILDGTSLYSFEGDVYAFGMTILEILTGNVPWFGKGEPAIVLSVFVKKEYPERPLEQVPKYCEYSNTLWVLLEACWSYEPATRPSATDVEVWIQDITTNAEIKTTASTSDAKSMAAQGSPFKRRLSRAGGDKNDEQTVGPAAPSGSEDLDYGRLYALQDPSWLDNLIMPGLYASFRDDGSTSTPDLFAPVLDHMQRMDSLGNTFGCS